MDDRMEELDVEGNPIALGPFYPGVADTPQPTITKIEPNGADYAAERLSNPLTPIYDEVRRSGPGTGLIKSELGTVAPERKFDFERAAAGLSGGSSAVAALDNSRLQRRKYDDEAPGREIDSKLKRADLQDRIDERQTKRKDLYDSMDPNSERSKNAAADFDAYLAGAAEDLSQQFPSVAASLKQQIGSANGKSAAQIQRTQAQIEARLGRVMKLGETEYKRNKGDEESEFRRQMARDNLETRRQGIEASRNNASAMRELSKARFTESQDEKQRARNEREAESYGKDMAPLNETEAILSDAKEAKKDVNTGMLSHAVQNVLKKFGFASDKYLKLEALQGTINNQITKLQSGSAVSAPEAARLREQLASLDQDDNEFDIKLEQMLKTIKLKQDQVKAKHPMTSRASSNSPPHGQTVTQNGIKFDWNGSEYIERK